MQKIVDRILTQYGSFMRLGSGSQARPVYALFRSVHSAALRNLESAASALGEVPQGLYTYIGPASGNAVEGELLVVGDKEYRFRKTETVCYCNQPVYQWGLCVEKGGEDTWGAQS